MISKIGIVILLIILITSCTSNTTSKIDLVSYEEIYERIEVGDFHYIRAQYVDKDRLPLSDTLRTQLNQGQLYREFYENEKKEIVEIRVRPFEDKKELFAEIVLRSNLAYPLAKVELLNVNCDSINMDLLTAAGEDQAVRNNKESRVIVRTDEYNRNLTVSYIEACGWEAVDIDIINSVFYIFQHMPSALMGYYYPNMKSFADQDILDDSSIAKMEDRLLMNNGYDQIYGTQVVHESFYQIKDPHNVNERRKAVGLPPIEEIAEKYGFVYRVEDQIE